MAETPPNILLIMADQLAAPALPIYGHPVVKAPHLEHLAANGVVFDNAYCNSPLCAPSRSSMMTGVLPSRIATYDNAAEWPSSVPTIAHYLRAQGYDTCLAGKLHAIGADQLHGYDERLTTDVCGSDYSLLPVWEQVRETADRYGIALSWGGNLGAVLNADVCKRSLQIDFDEEVQYQAVRKLYDLAREPEQRPFFLTVSFTQPHDPFTTTSEFWDLYTPEQIDSPRVARGDIATPDPYSARLMTYIGFDGNGPQAGYIRKARQGYYGMISDIDAKIGALMHTLEQTGYADNTVVLVTADHGEMLGERGLWFKRTFFEWSARVPLLIYAPDRFGPQRVHENVSLVDLLPTLFSLAGGNPEDLLAPVDGHSLTKLLEGDASRWNNSFMAEYLGDGTPAPCLMIRDGRYKFIFCEPDPPLLFDLEADPLELHNLAVETAFARMVADFEKRIHARWDLERLTRDILVSQQRRMLVDFAHAKGRYPIWDYAVDNDPVKRYHRRHEFWQVIEEHARLPKPAFIGTAKKETK